MRSHLTWSIGGSSGKCPYCDVATVLVTPLSTWEPHESDDNAELVDSLCDGCEVVDEVSGTWCPTCNRLVSLSLNTEPA